MNEHDIRDTAIRNTHPLVVTVRGGEQAWDQAGAEVTLHEAAIAAEIARLQALPPAPDYMGFLHALDLALPFDQIQQLHQAYGMFIAWCQFGNAARIEQCILRAKTDHPVLMSPAVYAIFQALMQTYHLPVVLP